MRPGCAPRLRGLCELHEAQQEEPDPRLRLEARDKQVFTTMDNIK